MTSLLALAARDALSPPRLERRPSGPESALSIAELRPAEDAAARAALGITHFAALAASRMLPENSLVLDLGSGSGAFATYLATHRPDVSVMAVEAADSVVQVGQQFAAEQNLTERVNINVGEMTEFAKRIPTSVDMITCTFGLNRLENIDALLRCLKEISMVRIRCGCSVLMFDFARPNLPVTVEEAPVQFLVGPSVPVLRRYRNSLAAAFTFSEVSAALGRVSLGTVRSVQSRGLKVFQAHWIDREEPFRPTDTLWTERPLPPAAMQQFKGMVNLMPAVKLPKHLS
ncbi:MAG: class I SAM-dependent methyltransferase [Capsulimonadaceae bacterium]